MPRGGKRPGAGRPKGTYRSCGRRMTSTTDLREMARIWSTEVIGTAKDPLGLLISVAADANTKHPLATRVNAASLAVPYLYPKLSAAVVESHTTVTRVDGRDLLDQLEARIASVPLTIEAHTDADDQEAA